ncbi:unnamed protein product, partial [Mesorhabditis spiculigera]
MEARLLALAQENERLRAQLERGASAANLSIFDLPHAGAMAPGGCAQMFDQAALQKLQALYPGVMQNAQLPMLQLCQLQAALQQQYPIINPYQNAGGVLLPNPQALPGRPENAAPSTPSTSGSSLLGALLSNRRPSPTVPQSSTESRSGLASPPREQNHNNQPPPIAPHPRSPCPAGSSSMSSVSLSISGSSKSDSESHSSASLSPMESSGQQPEGSRKQQYMERRRRNNEAAKRCRANRRAVFEYRSHRVEVLEGENHDLKKEIDDLKREIERCRNLITQRDQL